MNPGNRYRIGLLTIAFLLFSCRHTSEKERPLGSEPAWSAGDSLAFYFPQNRSAGLGFQYTRSDTFRENWYSSALFSLREPVLDGHYSEGGIYRFLWLRSFDPPVVFVLSRSGDQVKLTAKVLNGGPEFRESRYDTSGWGAMTAAMKTKTIKRFRDSLVAAQADSKSGIVLSETKPLTPAAWSTFEQLLGKAGFWRLPATITGLDDIGADGSEWIFESLQKDEYRFIVRWSPGGGFREAGSYLIRLSGFKVEIY